MILFYRHGLPALDFAGTATGIDVKLVLETGILPTVNTIQALHIKMLALDK